MSFRAALSVEEDEAEIMKRNGNETPAEGATWLWKCARDCLRRNYQLDLELDLEVR